jgi:hypothetical protein
MIGNCSVPCNETVTGDVLPGATALLRVSRDGRVTYDVLRAREEKV